MNVMNASDDDLALGMLLYLRAGAGSKPPVECAGFVWRCQRDTTKAEYARRFTRQMDRAKKGRGAER